MKKNNKEKISVVLLSWKRQKNLGIILDNLYRSDVVDEILLWNNNPKIKIRYSNPKLFIFNSPHNYGTLIRYCLAEAARNQHIMFLDDDLFLTPKQIEILFNKYIKNTSRIYGPFGRTLNNYKYVMKSTYGQVDIILGRTMIFHKSHLYKFFKYLGTNIDIVEDDILFSLSMCIKHETVDLGERNELPDNNALSKRKDHLERRQKMVNYCLDTIPGLKRVIDKRV